MSSPTSKNNINSVLNYTIKNNEIRGCLKTRGIVGNYDFEFSYHRGCLETRGFVGDLRFRVFLLETDLSEQSID